MSSSPQGALEHRFSGEHPLRTLLFLYREERARLIWGAVLYVIKHSPVWVMPLVTARIIDIRERNTSWLAWLMLMRKRSAPAWCSFSIIASLLEAGPSVARILTFLFRFINSGLRLWQACL